MLLKIFIYFVLYALLLFYKLELYFVLKIFFEYYYSYSLDVLSCLAGFCGFNTPLHCKKYILK